MSCSLDVFLGLFVRAKDRAMELVNWLVRHEEECRYI